MAMNFEEMTRCNRCGKIFRTNELIYHADRDVELCPHCGSDDIDDYKTEEETKVNNTNLTANTVRTITVQQQIEVPDFYPVVKMATDEIEEIKEAITNLNTSNAKYAEDKLKLIGTYIMNLFYPFLTMPYDKYKPIFMNMRGGLTKRSTNTMEECDYKVYVQSQPYNQYKDVPCFKVSLGIDNFTCVEFTLTTQDDIITCVNTREFIQTDPQFFKGWPDYKALLQSMIEDYINKYIKDLQAKANLANTMNNFLSKFSV